ncbi:MAG: class I SAM-dependent RNA methyltransferase [Chloroflexota bacterium]|nr:class I SAM-dependent RNA methyltransferase [Dehalococcoidia bacterium]MDW8253602.1 class I SAM-dependent RNA methyltransferase [Chloroflexota bacterium]
MTAGQSPSSFPRRTVRLEALVHGGAAIGRDEGRVIFVPFGLPGELVVIDIVEERQDYLRGRLVEVVEPSPDRVPAPCLYFGECGGCQWQHLAYPAQLEAKRRIVVEQLERIGKFSAPPVRPTIGCTDPWHYRNHARFSVRRSGHLGFTRSDHRRFLAVDYCLLMQPPINAVLAELQGKALGRRLHQVVVRTGARTGDVLVGPKIGDGETPLPSGQPSYRETMLGREFVVSPSSFFQVNTRPDRRDLSSLVADPPADVSQAELLVLLARDRLGLSGREWLVDAYCGVGLFALLLAPYCAGVVGIEESASALRDARRNGSDVQNVMFLQAKVEDALPKLDGPLDALIIDPPRAGCRPEVLRAILARRPPRVFYVSCEPATLARDLRLLVDGGYRLEEVQPVDLFPQTYHIETCTTLVWEGAR